MTTKEFLQQAFRLYRDLDSKLEQLARLRELAMAITSATDIVPSGNHSNSSRIEAAIVALHSQCSNLSDEIERLLAVRAEISTAISKVENDSERLLLEYRYLSFEPWKTVAQKMRLSLESVYRLHRQALKNFEIPAK